MTSPPPRQEPQTSADDFRSWLLTLTLAFGVLLALLYLADEWNSFGLTMVLVVPLYVGAIVGHNGRYTAAWKATAVGCLLLGVLVSLIMWNIAGLLCTAVAGIVLIVPMMVGALLGHCFHAWQRTRRARGASLTTALVVFGIIAISLAAESRLTPRAEIETVTTSRILDLSLEQAWQNLVFYEEVGLEPPMLTRIGLPYPLRTEGDAHEVGAITRCVYSTGYLKKRITRFEPMRELAFDVIEQHGVEDQSFELVSGRFEFESIDEGRTRVVLETVYRPLLQARFYWRPFEERLAHVLHDYVLDGMSIQPPPVSSLVSR